MVRALAAVLLATAAGGLTGCATDDPAPADDPGAGGGKADGDDAIHRTFDTYRAILEAAGGRLAPTGATVLGLRGLSLDGTVHDVHAVERYDDMLAILTPDGRVLEQAASTHPWKLASSSAQDGDGDGVGDVGMIAPGRYNAVARDASRDIVGQPTYHVVTLAGSDSIPGWRDTDHDGWISDAERAASDARKDHLGAILFHVGGAQAPAAIGCQVSPIDNQRALVARVGGRVGFSYVLVDAHDVAPDLLQ